LAEPEDRLQLVLGMASPSMFTEMFSEASTVPKDSLSKWFDEKTKTFGGRDAIETVTTLVGNSTRFDYQNLPEIPRKDLKDLKPFFESMLKVNKRMIKREGESISFKTPDDWLKDRKIPVSRRIMKTLFFPGMSRAGMHLYGLWGLAIGLLIAPSIRPGAGRLCCRHCGDWNFQ
jgi:hypothetical protein